jgi:FKBP12-rapamycin complex-associated protein
MMSTDLAALVGESYERAYTDMVRVQQLTELEEVIAYKEAVTRWVEAWLGSGMTDGIGC